MPAPPLTREQFLANLNGSGLLSPSELQQVQKEWPQLKGGPELAHALVKAGTLTRYQAELLLAGKTRGLVLGQYVLLKKRGKGGLGKVYKAIHKTMNRVVALKVLSPLLIKTDKARELFQREIMAVGRLVHPNIVTAYDASVNGDRPYLVMEYVDGPDLEGLVKKQGPPRPQVACEIIRQAALALQYAHEMGMLHRDIKPANILLQSGQGGSAWTVKLVDFGLARLQDPASPTPIGLGTILTKDNTVMGTPDYLSPEQSRDLHKVDIRSDLYSLGCTFYYLLTGRVPFPGGTSLDKMIRHTSEEPTPVEKLRPDIPREVVQVVRRLMAKSPEERFQTPAELARALVPLAASASSSNLNLQSGSEKQKQRTAAEGKTKGGKKKGAAKAGTLPQRKSAEQGETIPPSLSPTPLPEEKKGIAQKDPTGATPYGLYVALGMVLFIILLALLLSR